MLINLQNILKSNCGQQQQQQSKINVSLNIYFKTNNPYLFIFDPG